MKSLFKLIVFLLLIYTLSLVVSRQFNKEFFAASLIPSYEIKQGCAKNITSPKVIVVGGSSTNLGFDSKEFEKLSGKPTVNFAITAGIPLRVYFQMLESNLNQGDMVF